MISRFFRLAHTLMTPQVEISEFAAVSTPVFAVRLPVLNAFAYFSNSPLTISAECNLPHLNL